MLRLFLPVVIVFICFLAGCECTGCDPVTGPAGETKCTGKMQPSEWSVCLADDYLRLLSGGADQCATGTTYCWRPCSVESPKGGCTCNQQATVAPDPSLPGWCYSPPGKTCDWYRECLNKKHPCDGSEYDYALSFGERFCTAYDKTYHTFSKQGQEWIDAARRCLQVVLVPLLRPWRSPTCEEIQTTAFASHTGCYLSPAPGAPSICSLGALDWWRVFWTIKGAFVSETYETVKGFLETAVKGCTQRLMAPREDVRSYSAIVRLATIASPATSVTDDAESYARAVADGIARQLEWASSAVDWFAYIQILGGAQSSSPDPSQITILLGDKVALGLAQAADDTPPTDLKEIVAELARAVEMGDLDGIVKIKSLKVCNDLRCTDTYIDVSTGSGPSHGFEKSVVLLSGVVGILSTILI